MLSSRFLLLLQILDQAAKLGLFLLDVSFGVQPHGLDLDDLDHGVEQLFPGGPAVGAQVISQSLCQEGQEDFVQELKRGRRELEIEFYNINARSIEPLKLTKMFFFPFKLAFGGI